MPAPIHKAAVQLTGRAIRASCHWSRAHEAQHARPWVCASCRIPQQLLSQRHRRYSTEPSSRLEPPTKTKETPLVVTSEALPSHGDKQRWDALKRWSSLMDSALARASVAGQHINVYTGTDYSGIETLRAAILAKEGEVREQHVAVSAAKTSHVQARSKQAVSQKEIVGLLERKSSWSPADLERYMSLVRSEHVDDQEVQKAAEELTLAERQLESTRSLLEKLERQQYHEEQIWSDTIRRNSTWVTIGLMGINIVLLLAQITVFEPYRRHKIVDQIEKALDHRMVTAEAGVIAEPALTQSPEASSEQLSLDTEALAVISELETAIDSTVSPLISDGTLYERVERTARDLLSERQVSMKQSDRTALVLESAVSGIGIALVLSAFMLKT